MPKVSVIIPVYNVEKYLRQCLDSVVNQTLKDIEIICVNDGSTDNSQQILEEYAKKDKRIKLINQENQGQSVARNNGIEITNGEYIFFLDGDDYLNTDCLEKMINKILSPQIDIITSYGIAFADNKDDLELIKIADSHKSWLRMSNFCTLQVNIQNLSSIGNFVSTVVWGKLFKREFIKKNKLLFINKKVFHEDDGFFIKYMSCLPLIQSTNILSINYRIRKNSTMTGNCANSKLEDYYCKKMFKDALSYIKTYKSDNYKLITEQLKNSMFMRYFAKNYVIFKYLWTKNNKFIKILGLNVYNYVKDKDKTTTKFLFFKHNCYKKEHFISYRIPKIIHYCWFGEEPKPKIVQKCIKSWKKYLPDYEIKEWNDSHLGLLDLPYVKEAYEAKKYAFVSDIFRLYALKYYGGIYLDTDVEVLRSFDEFLNLNFFCSFENYYGNINPATAVIGSTKNCNLIIDFLKEYLTSSFIKNGVPNLYPNTLRLAKFLKDKYGIENYSGEHIINIGNDGLIFPNYYFINYKKNYSYSVHHYNASWCEKEQPKLIENILSIKNKYIGKKKIKYLTVFWIKVILKEKYVNV